MDSILSKLKGDKAIWIVVAILAMISIVAVYTSTKALAFKYTGGSTEIFALRHAFYLIIGFGLMYIAHLTDYNYYSKIAQIVLIACIPILILTGIFGRDGRWIDFPFINLSFQPSELAKVALIMYLARMITLKQKTIKSFKDGFFPIFGPVFLICLLIFPSDLSTATLIFITSLIMMFIGRVHFKHILSLITLTIVTATITISVLFSLPDETLQTARLLTWKHRLIQYAEDWTTHYADMDVSKQTTQARIAIATGYPTGLGPGKSRQKNFLPEAYADYIYSIIIEEYGFFGVFGILFLYLFFLYRSILIFERSAGTFGALLAISLAISIVTQAMMNMMVNVGLLPVTGVTLPLVSRGGTSIVMTCIAIGVILSVDHYSSLKKGRKKKTKALPAKPITKRTNPFKLGKI